MYLSVGKYDMKIVLEICDIGLHNRREMSLTRAYIHFLESADVIGDLVDLATNAADEKGPTMTVLICRPDVSVVCLKPLWEQERK